MIGRIMAGPNACNSVTLHGKTDFADVIKVLDLGKLFEWVGPV
jgi:hypothetical protein